MINLSLTREGMLAEIGASETALARPLDDPSDPAFLERSEARLLVRDTWAEILPRLRPALVRRFDDVAPERFIRDIGRPLKMGLGNADKRGHGRDPEKHITVEVVVTGAGAVIAVSDEGPGFDPAAILRRCRSGEAYFQHKGGGFKAFERAGSAISYANGGRTLLVRFLRGPREGGPGLAVDPGFMTHVLGKLSMISKRGHVLESCAIEPLDATGAPEVRYDLGIRDDRGVTVRTVLTGRVLSEAAALHEYTVAKTLYKGEFKTDAELCVPKPMKVFKLHPRLVLYRFDPGETLLAHLEGNGDRPRTNGVLTGVGRGLRRLHSSRLSPEDEEPDAVPASAISDGRLRRRLADALGDAVPRLSRVLDALENASARAEVPAEHVPVHGALDPSCIRGGTDRSGERRLFLYRLDAFRGDHPGVDVGGLLAGLSGGETDAGQAGIRSAAREAFLSAYLAGDSPSWLECLPHFVAGAHLAELDRLVRASRELPRSAAESVVERCERLLAA